MFTLFTVSTLSFANTPVDYKLSSVVTTTPVIADQYALNLSTFVGAIGGYSQSVQVDADGNIIVVGLTGGSLVTKNAFATTYGGGSWDVFVTKIAPNGTLLFSTFLGGNGLDEVGSVTTDSSGSIYIVGSTESSNFPILNAFNGTYDGVNGDAFLTKLSPSGNLLFSTYFGGNGLEYGNAVSVDATGNVYIAGITQSGNLPVKNAWNTTYGGGDDSFVAKFNSTGQLQYSTYVGGSTDDDTYAMAVNATGTVFITGDTISSNYPVINGYQTVYQASNDMAFVSEFNATGSLVYSTLFGGTSATEAYGISVDSNGNYAFVGDTNSNDLPTLNAFNSTFNANAHYEAFVTIFNASNKLISSTYVGGNTGDTKAYGVASDDNGSVYVTGTTYANDFPVLNAINSTLHGSDDVFVTKFNKTGSLLFSSFLGGTADDFGQGIATDPYQNIYVAGDSLSTDFTLVNAFNSTTQTGNDNAFVSKLVSPQVPQPILTSATPTTTSSNGTTSSSSSSSSTSVAASNTGQNSSSILIPTTTTISTPSFTIMYVLIGLGMVGIVVRLRRRE